MRQNSISRTHDLQKFRVELDCSETWTPAVQTSTTVGVHWLSE